MAMSVYLRKLAESFARSLVRSFVRSVGRSFVRSFVRSYQMHKAGMAGSMADGMIPSGRTAWRRRSALKAELGD
eukprot:scaffold1277_cov253-Pinguiococcus_pyrenoidosus.AAC.27